MKRKFCVVVLAVLFAAVTIVSGCAVKGTLENVPGESAPINLAQVSPTQTTGGSKVYFTGDISGSGLVAVYRALNIQVSGKVAIKLHMGEPGNTNYLRPDMVKPLADTVKASLVDSNTYYGGSRGTTSGHLQAAKEHGFTFAPVDILDSDGEIRIPIRNGRHQKEAILGKHIMDYDWIISVAHFKGHSQAGFGGTFKNLAIGIASPAGKGSIHNKAGGGRFNENGEPFFEKIVEYNQALMEAKRGRMLYINVLNNLSTSCDCDARAPKALMGDIGILASTDPVALEKASIDLIYGSPEEGKKHLIERIESRGGLHQIIYAERVGLGSQKYELIKL
jgi:uncharacterized Fe-S center protein